MGCSWLHGASCAGQFSGKTTSFSPSPHLHRFVAAQPLYYRPFAPGRRKSICLIGPGRAAKLTKPHTSHIHAACDSPGTSSALRAQLGSATVVEDHLDQFRWSRGHGYQQCRRPTLACVSLTLVESLERESDASLIRNQRTRPFTAPVALADHAVFQRRPNMGTGRYSTSIGTG